MHTAKRLATVQPRLSRRAVISALSACLLFARPLAGAEDLPPPLVSAVPIPEGQIDEAIRELDALAAEIMTQSGVPGMAVAVVKDGKTVYAKGFGVRKVGELALVDADTVFQLASVSKSIAGTIVARQVASGAVTWETPIVAHLPWFRLADLWVSQHVTIGDMLSHRSGLPDHGGDDLEDLGYDRRQVLERLRMLPLKPFRITYEYTNFGFTAGAEAAAVAAGKDWAALAEDSIYKPLGMASTSSRFADFEKRANKAVGHVKVGDNFEAKYRRQPDAQSPAGGVSSSVSDLAHWMSMVLQKGEFEGRPIIPAGALLPPATAQIVSSHSFAPDARPGLYGYGFGVGISPSGRVEMQHSGGFAMGAGTNFVLLPSAGVGIVVLTNAAPTGAAEAVAASFMDLVQFGKVERDWLAAYAPRMAPITAPVGSLLGQSPPADPKPAGELSYYAGTYANDYYGNLEIAQRGDGLVLKIGPAAIEYPLTHWDGDAFIFHPSSENQPDGSVSLASFKPDDQAGSTAVTIEYLDTLGLGTFRRK